MKALTLILILLLMGLTQCYYDQEGILYPESCTPSETPSYSIDVAPIMAARCNSCHSGSFPSGNIKVDSYSSIVVSVENGSLLGSIKHSGSFSPMPKNGSKLSNCEIQKIQAWIDAGALNN